MATIEDVARRAGLSRTTVSRVINEHPYVSITKKKKVMEAMEELGYVPNSAARSLRNQRTGVIAVLIPRVMNPFFSQLIETLEHAASESFHQLIICQTQYSAKKELTYLNLLKTKQVDGVILTSAENDWSVIEEYLDYGPIVLCNEFEERANVPMVFMDQKEAGYKATKHLIEMGHRKIAYCCGRYRSNVASAREEGFSKALAEAGLVFDERDAFREAITSEDGIDIFNSIRTRGSNRPTAIFTGSDEVAAGIVSEAARSNWSIPRDLAVTGFDNQVITELMNPRITTVEQPVCEMALKTMEVMMARIRLRQFTGREMHKFYMKLIIRESTKMQAELARIPY
ncbi:LacI family DNA-binding transcriptional regulator [Metabacillus sp. KIGAM252]|uniref:LacI family DNA-binding transcriptional regulator n=1 Tax=Metabacillus flavus TaxID=2823519 RepID=A0ABS5LCG3_9BACI|nr:LacI family DNA-binding transcriptional regulator [Metabacillus flavus]MBS2968273.1 LacI family DNA-binding transcriptional regulator [Metabacillus flavus]